MICGFDYGTSNCALGVKQLDDIRLAVVDDNNRHFMPSALYAPARELICEQVGLAMAAGGLKDSFIADRRLQLAQALRARNELNMGPASQDSEPILHFGNQAFESYFDDPEEGYFVKSPKSYLGASGLRPEFVSFFEDIVTAMMQRVKSCAETSLQMELTHTVIGRPVNFQGALKTDSGAEKSNQQALAILTAAAKRSGFKEVEFLYEPIAAGLSFERQLDEDCVVLVVDIGGGTSDCAMVRMGPTHRGKTDRSADFLAHTGERIGGNDLDIALAGKQLMPLFGLEAELKSGKPMPPKVFLDAVATNDVNALSRFASLETRLTLEQLKRDCLQPEQIGRLLKLQKNRQNQQLVRIAELAKIQLSDQPETRALLDFVECELSTTISAKSLSAAIERPVERIKVLMKEAVQQAGCQPDRIFVTGGSARSPILRAAIAEVLGDDIPVFEGDHFGSVVAGLTEWAERIYR